MNNWDSENKKYTNIIKVDTKDRAEEAIKLRAEGMTVREIAYKMGLSISRIYQYLR
jgi:DNA-binding CsgD family transcriptional regulator|tara:strand:- start:313 stop:480 length:168 start_codon:yes stop_codon:yes gene_type:complete